MRCCSLSRTPHRWVGPDEVDQLLRRGAGWLEQHPARDLIVRRYLKHQRDLATRAFGQLVESDADDADTLRTRQDAAEAGIEPAVKVRGREYLRIIYGQEYTLPEHLDRLRNRGLRAKRALAMQEFALGIEALERFVRREPLRRVHECVFGVLAMESEPIDPRL